MSLWPLMLSQAVRRKKVDAAWQILLQKSSVFPTPLWEEKTTYFFILDPYAAKPS